LEESSSETLQEADRTSGPSMEASPL
jgi:hypothetical protein